MRATKEICTRIIKIMKTIILSVLTILLTWQASAQMPQYQNQNRSAGFAGMNGGRFYGKVLDAKTNKPIDAATIQLSQMVKDTATNEMTEKVVALVISNKKGDFAIENIPVRGKYSLLITAVGYGPAFDEIGFDMNAGGNNGQGMPSFDKDLGNYKMDVNVEQLEGVVVTANKSMLQMGIDRKVFNVEKDISATGGTAVDVMKNVPSVSVDIDGNVSLRNKSPQLLVDGRPTSLTLDQIPADEIESVEIITNPSAKFDASGGGAGILNIILKKNRKPGYNGNLRANVDTKASYGLGGDLNMRQGKVNLFVNANLNKRKGTGENNTIRTDHLDDMIANFNQSGTNKNDGHFAFGRAGLDYFIDNRNTFSISGMVVNGKFNNTGLTNITRDTTWNSIFSSENGLINTSSAFEFKNVGGTLGFKHNFAKPSKDITADLNYSSSNNTGNSLISTQYFDALGNPKTDLYKQLTKNSGNTKNLIVQTDFTNPISSNVKLEAGLRGAVRLYESQNENFMSDMHSNDFIPLTSLNSKYKFNDQVYAGYVTYSQKLNNFSYQLGGRIESSFYSGEMIDSNKTFSNKYPFSFFPSVFLTQKLTDNQDIQLNYTRKINRPNFFQLIPYYDFSDSLNISKGNPGLKPEFTNLLELSYQLNLKNGNNIVATAYYRNTNDLITRYTYRDLNPNNKLADSIFISSFTNASSSNAYGLELTSMNRIAKWWNITTNVNLYNSSINGTNLNTGLTNNQVSWFGKINSTFTLPYSISIQLTADYTSKTILPPARGGGGGGMMWGGPMSTANGYSDPTYGFDLSVKKDLFKDRSASVSLSMNDVFATRVFSTHSRADFSKTVYSIQDNERFRNPQVVKLSFNWRFGKMDSTLFKRKNMKAEQQGMQNSMEGMQQ